MFLRRSKVTRGGKTYEYAQLVESFRREADGMPQHRVVANLGALAPLEFDNLKATLEASRKGRRVVVAPARASRRAAAPKPEANLVYLDVAVALELWRGWGLDDVLAAIMPRGESVVSSAKVVEVLVAQRLVDPDSKLAATRWFPHTALPELLDIKPGQLNNTRIHRVLDELESTTPTLMAKLPRLYREQEGAFASLFMDVTDARFVGHGPNLAVRGKTKEGLIERKIGIVLLCNERGYPLRWQVIEGNCNDGVAMTNMAKSISELDWAQDTPLVLDRAMGTTAHIQALAATKLKFLTALTRTGFSTYAPQLPWATMAEIGFEGVVSQEEVAAETARLAQAAGMSKVDDSLFVLDYGVVEPVGAEADELLTTLESSSEDHNAAAMRLHQQVEQAVSDGQYASYAAAATALGMSKDLLYKYRKLRRLAADIQSSIIEGKAKDRALIELIEIARLEDWDAQRAAFDKLVQSEVSRRAPATTTSPLLSRAEPHATSEPLRVRVVAYFNPKRFAGERSLAIERVRNIMRFVADLNGKLCSPRSRQKPNKILAAVDRRLRRDDLLEAFKVTVTEHDVGGRTRYQVALELDAHKWGRQRRYDGFSVLVAHPDLPHTAAELCQLYRAKDMVEKDFQVIKSVVELRPVRHRTDSKVAAHVTLCVLALLLERTLREKLSGKSSASRALAALHRCHLNRYRSEGAAGVYTITELDKEQRALLRRLQMLHLADDDHLAPRIRPR